MDVFVYGTLTDPAQVSRVVSEFEFRGAALLDGLHRVEGEYPTLAPGGSVSGRILRTPEIEALDAYEGVERGLYVRVSVPLADAEADSETERTVELYVGDPDALDARAEWPRPEEGGREPEVEREEESKAEREEGPETDRETKTFAAQLGRVLRENEVVVRRK